MPTRKAMTPEDVRSVARSHTRSMVAVLLSVARQKTAQPAARVAAAQAVLDRGWGKPQQSIDARSEITVIVRKLMSGGESGRTIDVTPLQILPPCDASDVAAFAGAVSDDRLRPAGRRRPGER